MGTAARRRVVAPTPQARVWLLTAALAVVAAVLLPLVPGSSILAVSSPLPWWAFAALFAAAELFVVHVEFRRDAHSFTLGEIPLVLGLFFLAPGPLIAAQLVGGGVVLLATRQQSVLKALFNLAQYVVITCVAVLLFTWLVPGGSDPLRYGGWGAALVAAWTASMLSTVLIFCAISLSGGGTNIRRLGAVAVFSSLVTLANTALGIVTVLVLWYEPEAAWLLLVPAATLLFAYRAYTSEREQRQGLRFLYESTRVLHQAPDLESAIVKLLHHARETFRAETAEMVLVPSGEHGQVLLTAVGPGERVIVMEAGSFDTIAPVWERLAGEHRAVLLGSQRHPEPAMQEFLDGRGLKDAMVAVLQGETRGIATMLVGDRLGDVGAFDREDLALFETLATHVSVALENGHLEQSLAQLRELEKQLSHQAFHDSLTGLANRVLFKERVTEALVGGAARSEVAVLFVDLDDFKTVNDTLGHEAGDELLGEAAERLLSCLRPVDTAARLGGDEFALLLAGVNGIEDGVRIAERVLDVLSVPMNPGGRPITVRASVGVASSPVGATSTEELLRNADMAMYLAKARGKGCYEVFNPGMRKAVMERHELKADLQRAVESGDFVLHYQPIVDLATGTPVAFEALLRWRHPERGILAPERFIALAEESGMLLPIGAVVLDEACRRAVEWQRSSPAVSGAAVAVNLSARQVQHGGVVSEVAASLRTSGLDPSCLVLEVTEAVMLLDPEAATSTLEALKELGVQLALDDFGTGYSSLGYLRQLPVDILKVSRPSMHDVGRASEAAFVEAIVRLGQSLGLRLVAEGVEEPEQVALLRRLRCDMAQGYFFGGPMEDDGLEIYLDGLSKGTVLTLPS